MREKQKGSDERKHKTEAVGIGIVSGIIASICCLGPVFIVLLGLSSLSVALSITQYQPYFLVLSIIFMAGAVWVYLRKRNQGHCDLNVIRRNKSFIAGVVIAMLSFYVVALYLVMPAVTPYIYGNVGGNSNPQPARSLREATLRIYGMTCPSCADAVESLIKQRDGVVSVSVNYFQGTGEVIYDPAKITTKEIMNAIQPYTATIVEDKEQG